MAPVEDILSDVQIDLMDKIAKNDIVGLRTILSHYQLGVDFVDDHGMTPLQHAAYKGNKEISQLLLDQGADVNSGQHEYSYTALHFAALSGNAELCEILLAAGAKSYATNSVGRTAAQMAAFVGNHACVVVINNFVPKSDIQYYTSPQGLETEPKLPPLMATPLHRFVMQVNLHPIRIAMTLQKSHILMENLDKVIKILKLMSEREMSRGFETNEIMSFKFHYLAFVASEVAGCKRMQEEQHSKKKEIQEQKNEKSGEEKKLSDPVELFAKKLLKINRGEVPEYQESCLRECIREFPNRECTIFRQMVTSLSRADAPPCLSVIIGAINGQRGFSDVILCNTCGEEKPAKKCSKCKAVQYCDRECQRLHWFMHKKACARLSTTSVSNNVTSDALKQEAASAAADALKKEIETLKVN